MRNENALQKKIEILIENKKNKEFRERKIAYAKNLISVKATQLQEEIERKNEFNQKRKIYFDKIKEFEQKKEKEYNQIKSKELTLAEDKKREIDKKKVNGLSS